MANKNKKAPAPAPTNVTPMVEGQAMAAPGTVADVTPKVKKTKVPKVVIPLTPAQEAAKAQMEKANSDAQAELLAQSGEKIKAADEKIAVTLAAWKLAKAERKAINKALGVKGVFGGKKATNLTFLQAYPEGKGAPQARAILEIVKAAHPNSIDRAKVVETMKTAINTKMDRSRLLSYYTSRMVADGVLKAE